MNEIHAPGPLRSKNELNLPWQSKPTWLRHWLRLLSSGVLGCSIAGLSPSSTWAGGLGGAWSSWLPTGTTTQTACATKARQSLVRQRFIRVGSDGIVAYGDLNSATNVSVYMICSALGDQILVLVSSRDISLAEMQRIRTAVANDFVSQ